MDERERAEHGRSRVLASCFEKKRRKYEGQVVAAVKQIACSSREREGFSLPVFLVTTLAVKETSPEDRRQSKRRERKACGQVVSFSTFYHSEPLLSSFSQTRQDQG